MRSKIWLILPVLILALLIAFLGNPERKAAGQPESPSSTTGIAISSSRPYFIVRDGSQLNIYAIWDEVDAPVPVIQGGIVEASSGVGGASTIQEGCRTTALGTPNFWVCRAQSPFNDLTTYDESNFFRLFLGGIDVADSLEWTNLSLEINNPAMLDSPATLGPRSSVSVPVAINSALVVVPEIGSVEMLHRLEPNQPAFVQADAIAPNTINFNGVWFEFSPGVVFSPAADPDPNQCQFIGTNKLRCEVSSATSLTQPIHIEIIPTQPGRTVTIISKFYRNLNGDITEPPGYLRTITLPVGTQYSYIPVVNAYEGSAARGEQ